MTVHNKMFDGKEKKGSTYHRVYVEFEGGHWVTLGVCDNMFQEMVEDLGAPKLVEFRYTRKPWIVDGNEVVPGETVEDK